MAGLAANWYRVLAGKGLQIIQVLRVSPSGTGMPTPEELRSWKLAHGASYEVVRDPQNNLPYLQFSVGASTIVIDRHQQIRYQGAPTWEELLALLQDLLLKES